MTACRQGKKKRTVRASFEIGARCQTSLSKSWTNGTYRTKKSRGEQPEICRANRRSRRGYVGVHAKRVRRASGARDSCYQVRHSGVVPAFPAAPVSRDIYGVQGASTGRGVTVGRAGNPPERPDTFRTLSAAF